MLWSIKIYLFNLLSRQKCICQICPDIINNTENSLDQFQLKQDLLQIGPNNS